MADKVCERVQVTEPVKLLPANEGGADELKETEVVPEYEKVEVGLPELQPVGDTEFVPEVLGEKLRMPLTVPL